MELRELDLNLLLVFQQLLVERRVSRVAEKLGISQPGVSNALARLRRHLDDPLFLRTTRGMEPTPLAEQLAEPVGRALELLQAAVNRRTVSWEPARSERSFTLGMTDIGEIYFLPRLMDTLAREAPGARVNTVRNTAVQLKDEMEAGHVDLAIGLIPQLKAGFYQRRLFRQRYVCLFRQGHALARKRRVTLADFEAAEHVVVVSAGTGHGKVDELLQRAGVRRRVRLTVPHFVAVGHILQSTDMVATVPERFAERFAQQVVGPFGLAAAPHPAALPEIAINLFWHARVHKDPANQWLRERVVALFGAD
jgi:DNA-binding transcriptional LysR family regulator